MNGDAPMSVGGREIGQELSQRSELAYTELLGGQVALWEGDAAEAVPMLERALAAHRTAGDPVGEAMTQLHLAMALSAMGRSEDAAELAAQCRILGEENKSPLVEFVRKMLGSTPELLAEPQPPADDDLLGRLSPREREVAELVAQGLSDREISTRLVISQRTVESHMGRILARLEFSSRVQVATYVARRVPVAPQR